MMCAVTFSHSHLEREFRTRPQVNGPALRILAAADARTQNRHSPAGLSRLPMTNGSHRKRKLPGVDL